VAGLYKQAFRFDGDDLLLARSSPGAGLALRTNLY
jgi:hypothetical protein